MTPLQLTDENEIPTPPPLPITAANVDQHTDAISRENQADLRAMNRLRHQFFFKLERALGAVPKASARHRLMAAVVGHN